MLRRVEFIPRGRKQKRTKLVTRGPAHNTRPHAIRMTRANLVLPFVSVGG